MAYKYRIAIIAGQLVVGGAERQLYLWLSKMDRGLFDPIVLTLHPNQDDYWENKIEALGISIFKVPHYINRFFRVVKIIDILRPYHPDLIHGWHSFSSPYAGIVAKLIGAKSMGGVRGSYRAFLNSYFLASAALFSVDSMLVNSFSASNSLRKIPCWGRRTVYTVQNAIGDQSEIVINAREKLGTRYNIETDSIWLGSVGRLDPQKRYDLLLRILALLNEQNFDFRFIFIGDGVERLRLERLTLELGLREKVIFVGEISQAQSWLNALDVFCFTSLDEGIPNAVMEAAVAELPIVGWRVNFMQELLDDGRVACLVEAQNLFEFRDALLSLIQNPDLRHQYGQNAREHVLKNFSIERFVQQMTLAYEDLLSADKRPMKNLQ